MPSNIVLTKFLSKYTSIDFYKEIVNIALYPSEFTVTVGSNDYDSVPNYLNSFFKDLGKILNQYGHEQKGVAEKLIDCTKSILKLRSAGSGLITYETIDQHYNSTNAITKKLISDVKDDKIQSDDQFRQKIEHVVTLVDYYYDIQRAVSGSTKIHEFLDIISRPEIGIIEALESYKDMSLQLHSDLSNLATVAKSETATEYYELSDSKSILDISENITNYIFDNYTFFKTGLDIFDKSIDGMEASSVHVIAAPSNAGKSITLSNLFYKLAQQNQEQFQPGDAALFIS